VFQRDGTFVKEITVAPDTRVQGAVWDLDFSVDAAQTYLYTADGENNHVWVPAPGPRTDPRALRPWRAFTRGSCTGSSGETGGFT